MNQKTKMIIIVSVILILVILVFVSRNRKKNNNKTQNNETISTITNYDEEESLYRVVNDETGEILYEGYSEEEAYLYQIDPTYKPSNPDNIDDFEIMEEE